MINQTNWPLFLLGTWNPFTISFIAFFPELCNHGWNKAIKSKPNDSKIQDFKIRFLKVTNRSVEVKIHIRKLIKFEAILLLLLSLLTTLHGIWNVLIYHLFLCLLTVGNKQKHFFLFKNLLQIINCNCRLNTQHFMLQSEDYSVKFLSLIWKVYYYEKKEDTFTNILKNCYKYSHFHRFILTEILQKSPSWKPPPEKPPLCCMEG